MGAGARPLAANLRAHPLRLAVPRLVIVCGKGLRSSAAGADMKRGDRPIAAVRGAVHRLLTEETLPPLPVASEDLRVVGAAEEARSAGRRPGWRSASVFQPQTERRLGPGDRKPPRASDPLKDRGAIVVLARNVRKWLEAKTGLRGQRPARERGAQRRSRRVDSQWEMKPAPGEVLLPEEYEGEGETEEEEEEDELR